MGQEPLSRILLPLDFSRVSDALLDFAVKLASKYSSEILLVHVIEESVVEHVAAGYDVSGFVDELEEKAKAKLGQYADKARSQGIRARIYENMIVGDPAAVISNIASEEGASEILAASKGWGIRRLIPLGSTVRLLAALSPIPLIRLKTVKEGDNVKILGDPEEMFSHILMGVDSTVSKGTIEYTASLAAKTGARVTVVHVIEDRGDTGDLGFVDDVVSRISGAGVEVSRVIVSGKPYKRIIEVSNQLEANSILVERRVERQVLREVLLGSTLVNLLNKANKPVIVVPATGS
ncbi:MAG: universal stress protein [Desulfurococcales archaeon]|nr:universal stress protein [Desulfurococcales archaeon]MCE4605633.1 universal stress protein [Desulfurococcales archaeon]